MLMAEERRTAFEFLEGLGGFSSADAILGALDRVLANYGIEHFTFQDLPRANRPYEEFAFCTRVPAEWLQIYLREEYVRVDPAFRQCRRSIEPFVWADAPYDAEREPRAVEFLRRATDFGLARGLMIPVPREKGGLGVVWFGGTRMQPDARTRPLLHLLALYTFERLRSACGHSLERKPPLTHREREVLVWAAQGKSAWEIGEILRIAKRTVDEHVQSACHKLGAANRTQAVAIALRDHLIEP
jgi:LuxR family quorum sensing-dependent transcriptional regulator